VGEVKAVKSVTIPYQPSEAVLRLLKDFRDMVNYCIKVGLDRGITSRFMLTREVYHGLTQYGYHSWYALSAIEIATAILKNYRKAKRKLAVKPPRARKLMAKIGNQGFKIEGDRLRIPLRPVEYIYITLHKRAKELLVDSRLKLGSVTLTPNMVYVSFSRMAEVEEPEGYVAIDVNEDNITAVSSDGEVRTYDLSGLKRAGYGYFERRRSLQRRYHGDRRVLRKALSKLSKNYRNRVSTMLHQVSTAIVKWCREKGYGLIHEDLKGLRRGVNRKVKRFNRFSGRVQEVSTRSKRLKRRLNNWWFRKFLDQIEYKALWEGIKTIESKHTRGSSSTCAICGSRLTKYPNAQVECLRCGLMEDRHIVACLNLLRWEPAVRARPPLRCSRDPRPNEAYKPMRTSVESQRGEGNYLSPEELPEPKNPKAIRRRAYIRGA
jgi:putative transposase